MCPLAQSYANVSVILLIWQIIFTQYLIKLAYEFLMLPVTYTLVKYLKKADKMDYYDIDTKFTPFSLKLTN